jgi:DNA-binding MarR family transcriptional regulator
MPHHVAPWALWARWYAGICPYMDPVPCYCAKARSAARLLTAAYDRALEPVGLKVTQFSLMRAIERRGGASLTVLAESTGLDRSTLGRNLRVLQRDGLVTIGSGKDPRVRTVRLTERGRRLSDEALPHWRAAQRQIKALLNDGERAALDGIVRKLATSLPPEDRGQT